MAEVVNVIVAFAVIIFLFRWVTTSKESPAERSAASALGFRPKHVTNEMTDTVHSMFPDIPIDNIRYDLLRTGSVEQTTNKILERGYLDAPPPAYYNVYPRTAQPPVDARRPPAAAITGIKPPSNTLISRFHLEDVVTAPSPVVISEEELAGKAVWEDTPEKREASLKERKAKMILAARHRMLAQQHNTSGSSSKS